MSATETIAPEGPGASDFRYVDTAVGGAHNRNHVMALADFHPPPTAEDVFATYFRFTHDLVDYAARNPTVAPDKRPSVARYAGPASASFYPTDFDAAGDPDRARTDTVRLVRVLAAEHGVPPAAMRILFSGNKGWSVELPGSLFGGFAPATDLAVRFKRLARALVPACPTLDLSIYEALRLWRWPNSRHGRSGLYKIRLTRHELEHVGLDEIRALASRPRLLPDDAPDDDWLPRPALVAAWEATVAPARDACGEPRPVMALAVGARPLSAADAAALVTLMAEHWRDGHRHDVSLGLAGWLALAGVPEAQAVRLFRALSADDRKPDDRFCCLRDTYQRRRDGAPVAGPSRLREHLPREALDALGRLLGASADPSVVVNGLRLRNGAPRLRVREGVSCA